MEKVDTAKLRELAQAVLDTQGADHACLAYHNHLTGMHPADVLALLDEVDALKATLKGFLNWADQKCPCHNDQPDPCPLCLATVEGLEPCKAADQTLPPQLLKAARAALSGGAR